METLRREHFNRWYNLIPYYLSIISFEIPFQVELLFGIAFILNLKIIFFFYFCSIVLLIAVDLYFDLCVWQLFFHWKLHRKS